MEDEDDSLVMGLGPNGDSEFIQAAIGHTTDDIRLTPKQRKMQSGFSSILQQTNKSEPRRDSSELAKNKSNHNSVNTDEPED